MAKQKNNGQEGFVMCLDYDLKGIIFYELLSYHMAKLLILLLKNIS